MNILISIILILFCSGCGIAKKSTIPPTQSTLNPINTFSAKKIPRNTKPSRKHTRNNGFEEAHVEENQHDLENISYKDSNSATEVTSTRIRVEEQKIQPPPTKLYPHLLPFCVEDNRCGVFDTDKSAFIVDPIYYKVFDFRPNGLARIQEEQQYGHIGVGYINTKGQLVISPTFDGFGKQGAVGFENGDFSTNGLARVRKDGKYGYINAQGQLVDPAKLANYGSVSEKDGDGFSHNGLALVKQNGKYGYINEQGQLVIPATFDQGNIFYNGLAEVVQDSKKKYINAQGKTILYKDSACDTTIFKNGGGHIVWPRKSTADICAEASSRSHSQTQRVNSEQSKYKKYACSFYCHDLLETRDVNDQTVYVSDSDFFEAQKKATKLGIQQCNRNSSHTLISQVVECKQID